MTPPGETLRRTSLKPGLDQAPRGSDRGKCADPLVSPFEDLPYGDAIDDLESIRIQEEDSLVAIAPVDDVLSTRGVARIHVERDPGGEHLPCSFRELSGSHVLRLRLHRRAHGEIHLNPIHQT